MPEFERFPAQFALSILQLNEQRNQRQRELEEMRNQRAAQNFLEKERLNLQAQGQAMDFARTGQAQAATEKAQEARIQLETEKIKLEREGLAAKAFDDFNRYGTAFLPNTSAGDISKFRDTYNRAAGSTEAGGYTLHEFEIPGQGVLLQRIGGPGFEHNQLELEKTRQEIEGLKQTRALQLANQQLSEERAETERTKRLNLVGGVTVRDAEFARSAIETYRKNAANALKVALTEGDTKRAASIATDWKQAFGSDKATLDRVSNLEAIIDAHVESVRTGRTRPDNAPPDINALKRAGVADTYFEAAGQQLFAGLGERIVGRVTAGPGSAPRGTEGTFLVTESGRQVPVSAAEAEQTQLGSKLDPSVDPANRDRAKALLDDALAGRIPRDDPNVKQAVEFLRAYAARIRAAR